MGIGKGFAWGIGVAIGGAVLAIAAAFLPSREVHYAFDASVFACRENAYGRVCSGSAWLSVGNTGNVDQTLIRVRLPREAANWRMSPRVLEIRASTASRPRPAIRAHADGPDLVLEISPLPQNTLVEFEGHCFNCSEALIGTLTKDRIRVEADGRVKRGDPRVMTFLRWLANLLLVLVPGS